MKSNTKKTIAIIAAAVGATWWLSAVVPQIAGGDDYDYDPEPPPPAVVVSTFVCWENPGPRLVCISDGRGGEVCQNFGDSVNPTPYPECE